MVCYPASSGFVVAPAAKDVEFEGEVFGSIGGFGVGQLGDVAQAALVLVHVGFVDE
ncbi:hypothetical protein OIO89_00555 (plasmid) [Mycobacterium ulcerans]|nr:hypothetical protein OIO89_00555 [Mycobacterium ulcerans]